MGLLYLGTPLTWDEAKKHADHVRYHGITQFLHTWDRLKDKNGDELLWGDEVWRYPSFMEIDLIYFQDRVYGYLIRRC